MADAMTHFDIKKGWFSKIDGGNLKTLMEEVFGSVKEEGELLVSSYGAMARIEAKIVSKTVLDVATTNVDDTKALSDEEILNSKSKLNEFLEQATGFDANARMKRAQQKAKKGEL